MRASVLFFSCGIKICAPKVRLVFLLPLFVFEEAHEMGGIHLVSLQSPPFWGAEVPIGDIPDTAGISAT